jgi:hypothetical protein
MTFCLGSCFSRHITIYNSSRANLLIETTPVIRSGSGGWENGIEYALSDSIIWRYEPINIHAIILKPRLWRTRDTTADNSDAFLRKYYNYGFDFDKTVSGLYSMYPQSSFTVGFVNSRRRFLAKQNELKGQFIIRSLKIYKGNDTLYAKTPVEVWNLLLSVDKNPKNKTANGQRRKSRSLEIMIE